MRYVMITGPMGAGKSTFMRSLPKPWGNFVTPEHVPDTVSYTHLTLPTKA